MPTFNRHAFIPLAISCFLKQDYPNLELVVVDDSESSIIDLLPRSPLIKYHYNVHTQGVGLKRNFACKKAEGEIIIHLDDDDYYAPDWVSCQVNELTNSKADVCGINQINFYALGLDKSWQYTDPEFDKPWIYGATFAYWKSFWEQHPFKDFQAGEDNDFIWNNPAKIHSYRYTDGYLGLIHQDNIAMRPFDNPREKITVMKWMKTIKVPEKYHHSEQPPLPQPQPLVTCIMPTANRRKFISTAISYFLDQDYRNKELIIIDDGLESIGDLIPANDQRIKYSYSEHKQAIGTKRNLACEMATGSIIMHWDDDDWYAPDWISYQTDILINSEADICGLDQIQFYSILDNKYWMTKNYNSRKLWLSGATLAYRKSFWRKNPFKNLQIGEDDNFVRSNGAKLYAHNYYQGFIALIHPKNTSVKVFQS